MPTSKLHRAVEGVIETPQRIGERTIVFFDAVMAIAITLLVLEIGIPEAESFGQEQLAELFVPFTALCVSFVALGQLWYLHTKAFSNDLMTRSVSVPMHIILMFLIVLFPKTTELISQYPSSSYAIAIYLVCYTLLIVLETITIISSLRKSISRLNRSMKTEYDIKSGKEMLKGAILKSDRSQELIAAANKVLKAISYSTILAIVTTFGAVFALIFLPAACYAFFVIEIVGSVLFSRYARDAWGVIGASWSQLHAKLEAESKSAEASMLQ